MPDAATVHLPRGYWRTERTRPILDKVLEVTFEVNLDGLGDGERGAIAELVAASRLLQQLAEDTEHRQALGARRRLGELHERLGRPAATADLIRLYEISQGPIATTLDNELQPFLPVDRWVPGRNVYPWGIAADEVRAFVEARPDRRAEILGIHTVVRRTTPQALRRDLATLRRRRELDALHPGLRDRLEGLVAAPDSEPFYAVPYSVAWPARILAISRHVWRAATAVEPDDPDFAAFLRQRSRDLLTDDNEAGDAAWVRGSFRELDAVVGAYDVYDDDLFGAKAFFGLTIMRREPGASAELRARLGHLQAIEDALPIDRHRTVTTDVRVGSYDVISAVGQGMGVLAEILPDDADLIRKYGRKIILRHNYAVAPAMFERVHARWRAAMAPVHHDELTAAGNFRETTWHEVGHYLGPDTDRSGRTFEVTLGEDAPLFEELKSELLSVFASLWLQRAGEFTQAEARQVIASSVMAGLRPVRPRRSEPYALLYLMELNYFLDGGLLRIEADGVHLDYDRAPEVYESMLREVLAIMDHGSRKESNPFIERYSTWDERHERIAANVRASERYRSIYGRFPALQEG